MTTITLDPEETGYLLGLLKEHVSYYETLAGSTKPNEKNKELCKMLRRLWTKLSET